MNNITIQPSFKANTIRKANIKKISKPILKEIESSDVKIAQTPFWKFTDELVTNFVFNRKKAKYSKDPQIREIEKNLQQSGVNVRFNNDINLAQYISNGIEILKSKSLPLPKNIIFIPGIITKFGILGLTYMLNKKEESPIILPKNIVNISTSLFKQENNNKTYSTKNPMHIFFHEIGHWLHYQKGFSPEKNAKIYAQNHGEEISQNISSLANTSNDGSDFCAEIFAAQIDGKICADNIIKLAKKLNAPLIK